MRDQHLKSKTAPDTHMDPERGEVWLGPLTLTPMLAVRSTGGMSSAACDATTCFAGCR